MLDECKGEKFFEVLASFSAIVLKKVLASQPAPQSKTAVARKLATSTSLSNQEQASLLPLAIAHRAALVNLLRKKEEKRARYMDFANLLDTKAEEINKRIRKAVGTPRSIKPAVPQREADAIKKQLKDNWIGDQRWVDVILHGDDAQADAGFLNAPFQKVWRVVDQGRRLEDAVPEVGLLENLQLRVDEQKARLDKWKEFHTRMQGGMAASNTPKESNIAAKEFKFDDHLQFQLRKETSATEPAQPQKLRPAYQDILLDMDEELAQAATARYNRSSAAPLVPGRRTSYAPVHHVSRSQSDLVPSGTSRIAKPPISSRIKSDNIISRRPSLLARPSATAPINSEATLVGRTSTLYTAASPSPTTNPPTESPPESPTEPPTESYSPPLPQHAPIDDLPSAPTAPASPEQTPIINSPSPPSSPPQLSSSPPPLAPFPTEESLAAQIVSTIGTATPSPVKQQPRLSLIERTRMTMSRTPSFSPIPEISSSPGVSEIPLDTQAGDPHEDLMERTRKSMMGLGLGRKVSLGTKHDEDRGEEGDMGVGMDTPLRGRRITSGFLSVDGDLPEGVKTPKEDLFSEDVEYDRVFRSRPRIATSPVFGTPSPTKGMGRGMGRSPEKRVEVRGGVEEEEEFDEGVTGVDLGDVDMEDGDEDEEVESPSRRAWR